MTAAVLAAAVVLVLAVVGAGTLAWLASPASPCPPVAWLWRRLLVVTMLPVPGGGR